MAIIHYAFIKQVTVSLVSESPGKLIGSKTHCLQCRRTRFSPCVRKIPWRRERRPTPGFLVFPDGSDGKEAACSVGDLVPIPGSGRSPGGGHGYPLQYSCLENPKDRGACWATVRGITESQKQLGD